MHHGLPLRKRPAVLAAAVALALAATACGSSGAPANGPSSGRSTTAPPAGDGDWHYDHVGPSRSARLTAVTAVAADDAWAVGAQDGDGAQRPFVLHYDGRRWASSPVPAGLDRMPMEQALLRSSAPDDVWLFAGTEARRFDGKGWRDVAAPFPHPTAEATANLTGPVTGAAVLGRDDVWAVGGGGTARHWDGRAWRDVRLPAEARTLATGPSGELWAFGSHRIAEHGSQPAAMRWDGRAWRTLAVPETHHTWPHLLSEDAEIQHAAVRGPDDVWAQLRYDASRIGDDGEETPETEVAMLHWDGRTWSRVAEIRCCGGPFAVDARGGVVLSGKLRLTEDGRSHRLRRPAPVPGLSAKVTRRDRDQGLDLADLTPIPGTRQILAVGTIASAPHVRYFFHRPVVARYPSAAG